MRREGPAPARSRAWEDYRGYQLRPAVIFGQVEVWHSGERVEVAPDLPTAKLNIDTWQDAS